MEIRAVNEADNTSRAGLEFDCEHRDERGLEVAFGMYKICPLSQWGGYILLDVAHVPRYNEVMHVYVYDMTFSSSYFNFFLVILRCSNTTRTLPTSL